MINFKAIAIISTQYLCYLNALASFVTLKPFSGHDLAVSSGAVSSRAVSCSDCDIKLSSWQSYYHLNFIIIAINYLEVQ